MTDIGEGIAEVEILKWFIKPGDVIKEFDPLCEVMSDKATVQITSKYNGKIIGLYHKEGDIAKVGLPLMKIDTFEEPDNLSPLSPKQNLPRTTDERSLSHSIRSKQGTPVKVLASPAVRHLAAKQGINLSMIEGKGKDGRIRKEDILNSTSEYLIETNLATPEIEPITYIEPSIPIAESDTVIPLRGYRRAMAQTMTESLSVPHLLYAEEITMDNLMIARKTLKPLAESHNIKLTYMPFIIKAVSLSLKKFPILNSTIDKNLTQITLKQSHNVSIAVDTPNGLTVPNIKNVQNLNIFEIAKELSRISENAQSNKISPEDLAGGTISLSNIGAIGGIFLKPILLVPQVCIGAIGRIQKVPRFDSRGEVVPVHLMGVSWSCDHRVVDGASVARFCQTFKGFLEEPVSMLSELK